MKNTSIIRIINNSKRNINRSISKEQKDSVRIYINVITKICQDILKENPNVTAKQLYDMFSNYIVNICDEYCRTANIRGMLFQLEAVKKLIENKELIMSEYEKVKGRKPYDEHTIYTANISSNCTNVVHQAVTQINEVGIDKKDVDKKIIDIVHKYSKADKKNRAILRNQNRNMDLDMLEKTLPVIFSNDYATKVEMELKILQDCIEKDIKDQQIKVMGILGDFFDDFGQVEVFTKKHLQRMQKTTKADLGYEVSTEQYNEDDIGIKEIFSKEFLKSQSVEYLSTYSLFWQNRFAKICKDINIAQFAITDMNLWDEIASGRTNLDISDKDLEAICKKQIVLSELTAQMLSELSGGLNSNKVEYEQDGDIIRIYDKDKIKQYQGQEGENYKKIFDQVSPNSKNILENDLGEYKTFFNQVENVYKIKDGMLGCKTRELFDSKKTKNWGIIIENNNSDKILIAIDYEGINMPLRLHINRNLLADLLRLKNIDTKIPLYDGQDDFIKDGEAITSNVLMPLPNKHKVNIRNRLKELKNQNTEETKFLEHLMFLADQDKYPKHLKQNGRRPARRYIDLSTGDFFIKEGTTFIKTSQKDEMVGIHSGR